MNSQGDEKSFENKKILLAAHRSDLPMLNFANTNGDRPPKPNGGVRIGCSIHEDDIHTKEHYNDGSSNRSSSSRHTTGKFQTTEGRAEEET